MEFKKQLITAVAIPLVIILALSGGLLFLSSNIQKKSQQIINLQKELNLRLKSAETLVSLHKDSKEAEEYFPALQNVLPTRDQLVTFPRDLNNIAKQSQVNLNLTLGKEVPKTDKDMARIEFVMTLGGKFDNISEFLKGVEKSRYYIKFNSFDFVREGGDNFKVLLNGQVFFF